jgi:hypothetical protein
MVFINWDDLEDEIADAIDDSLDVDWTGRIGARAVIRFLKERAERACKSRVCHVCGAVGSADHTGNCSESW